MTDFQGSAGQNFNLEVGPVLRAGTLVPVDLSLPGTEMWLTAKRSRYDVDADAVFTKTADVGGIQLNSPVTADKNLATVTVLPADTQEIVDDGDPIVLVWECWLKEPDDRESRVDHGLIKLQVPVLRTT